MAKIGGLAAGTDPGAVDQEELVLPPHDASGMSAERLDAEIAAGWEDVRAGRARPASDVFADMAAPDPETDDCSAAREAMRDQIAAGAAQADQGELYDGPAVMAALKARHGL